MDESKKPNAIVFAGNSLIEQFDLSRLNNPNVINRGVGGDFTEGLLKRLAEITAHYPQKIFIEIGINDVLANIPECRILSNYEKIIKKIKNASPDTKIYVQSLLPTGFEDGFFVDNEEVNKKILAVNSKLQETSKVHSITYIDIHTHFLSGGKLNTRYTHDGVHLTEEGYNLWRKVIGALVNSD